MPTPPTNENINFPAYLDTFPQVTEPIAGNLFTPGTTTIYSAYYNKIRTFIGVMEPIVSPQTAQTDGTINGLSDIFTVSISMAQLTGFINEKKSSTVQRVESQVLPFEIVFQGAGDPYNYTLPSFFGNSPFLFNLPNYDMNKIAGIADSGKFTFFNGHPLVSCVIYQDPNSVLNYPNDNANPQTSMFRYLVSHYVVCDSTCLIVRGAIYDMLGAQFPPIANATSNYHWRDELSLRVSITFPRRQGT